LNIAVILGDDLMDRQSDLRRRDTKEMDRGESLPPALLSMNAYLGAKPVADALALGADVVITGRLVDSALVLGPLIHEFQWSLDDYDRLAQGSLAGHIIECGTQCTGGNFTDWDQVPGYDNMGFPIALCRADGSFAVTKPDRTGGVVTAATVGEQLVYEIGDPRAYILPDVVCDFTQVALRERGRDCVEVTGAKGYPPPTSYKVSATVADGYRCTAAMMLGGMGAREKAERVGRALITRTARLFEERGFGPFRETHTEILGAEAIYGPHARAGHVREVVARISVSHDSREALHLFSREIAQAATATAPGISSILGGRPRVSPVVRLFSFLIPKQEVGVVLHMSGQEIPVEMPDQPAFDPSGLPAQPVPGVPHLSGDRTVPLVELARARSGDKGNHANIGVIARHPDYIPYIRAALTEDAVARYLGHVLDERTGTVTRWELPGIHAFNFLLKNSLGGGGVVSLRVDPQGKTLAQQLLEFPVPVPEGMPRSIARK
jgi:hypothetical protein